MIFTNLGTIIPSIGKTLTSLPKSLNDTLQFGSMQNEAMKLVSGMNLTSESTANLQNAMRQFAFEGKSTADVMRTLNGSTQSSFTTLTRGMQAGSKEAQDMSRQLDTLGKSGTQLGLKIKSIVTGLGTMAIMYAVVKVISLVANHNKELADNARAAAEAVENENVQFETYKKRIEDCYAVLNDSKATYEDTVQAHKDLYAIKSEMIGVYGEEVKGIDLVTDSIDGQTAALKRLNEESAKKAYADYMAEQNKNTGAQKWYNFFSGADIEDDSLRNIYQSLMSTFGHTVGNGGEFQEEFGTNYDNMVRKYEEFTKKINLTTNDALNNLVAAYDNIEIEGGKFVISGNVDDVQDTIIDIQTTLSSYDGYTEEWDKKLQGVYSDAKAISDELGNAYKQGLEVQIGSNSEYSQLQDSVDSAYKEYINAMSEDNELLADQAANSYIEAIKAVKNADIPDNIKDFIITLHPDMDVVSMNTVGNLLATNIGEVVNQELSYRLSKIEMPDGYSFDEYTYEEQASDITSEYLDSLSATQRALYEISQGAFEGMTSAELLRDKNEEYVAVLRAFAIEQGITYEQLLEILKQQSLIDNRDNYINALSTANPLDVSKKQIIASLTSTDEGWQTYLALLDEYGAEKVAGWDPQKIIDEFNRKWEEVQDEITPALDVEPTILDGVNQIDQEIEKAFGALGDAYQKIFYGGADGGFDANAIDNATLKSLEDAFDTTQEGLQNVKFDTDKLNEAFAILGSGTASAEEAQQAFNDLATEWYYATTAAEELSEANADIYKQGLEKLGVVNYDEVIDAQVDYARANQKLFDEIDDATAYVSENIDSTSQELRDFAEGGNVNLNLRPVIDTSELLDAGWEDAAGDVATVFTSTFTNEAEDIAMNFTPIIADPVTGQYKGVLSPSELQRYAEDVISGVREDDLNLQIGCAFEGEDAIAQAEAAAEAIHNLHEEELNYNTLVDAVVEGNSEQIASMQAKINAYLNEIAAADATRFALFQLAVAELQESEAWNSASVAQKISDLEALAEGYLEAGDAAWFSSRMQSLAGAIEHGDSSDRALATQELEDLNDLYDTLRAKYTTPVELDFKMPNSTSGASGSGKDAADAYNEAFQNELDNLDFLRDNEFIDTKEYLDQLRALIDKYYGDIEKYPKEYYENMKKYLDALKDLYDSASSAAQSAIQDEIDALEEKKSTEVEVYEKQITEIEKVVEGLNDQKDAYDDQKEAIQDLIDDLQDVIDEYEDQKDAIDDLIDEQNEYIEELDDQIDAIDKLIKPLDKQIKAYEKEQKAIEKLEKPIEKQIDKYEDEKKAIDKLIKPLNKKIKAYQKQQDALDDLIKPLNKEIDGLNEELDALREANDERQKAIDLQRDQFELERAMNQRTKLIYSDQQGYHYENDASAVSNAKEALDQDIFEQQTDKIQKQINAIQDVIDGYNDEKDAIQELIDEIQDEIEVYEDQKEAIDDLIEPLQDQLDLYNDQKEAIDEKIEAIQEEIDKYDEQKEALEEMKEPYQDQIDAYEKQKDAIDKLIKPLNDQIEAYEKQQKAIDDLIEPIDKQIKAYEKQKTQLERNKTAVEEYYDSATEKLEKYKKQWEELAKIEERAQNRQILASLGYSIDDIKNMDQATFDDFKNNYLSVLNDVYANGDDMPNALLAENGGYAGSYLANTLKAMEQLDKIDLTSVATAIDTCNGAMQTFTDRFCGLFGADGGVEIIQKWETNKDGILTLSTTMISASAMIEAASEDINGSLDKIAGKTDETTGLIKGTIDQTTSELADKSTQFMKDEEDKTDGYYGRQQERLYAQSESVLEQTQLHNELMSVINDEARSTEEESTITFFGLLSELFSNIHDKLEKKATSHAEKTEAINREMFKVLQADTSTGGDNVRTEFDKKLGEINDVAASRTDEIAGKVKQSVKDTCDSIKSMADSAIDKLKSLESAQSRVANKQLYTGTNPGMSVSGAPKTGAAFFNGTPNGVLAKDTSAIRSEYGQQELTVYPNGTYEITDKPVVSTLPAGTKVFNYDQTRKILKNGKKSGMAFANGTGATYTPLSSANPERYALLNSINRLGDAVMPHIDAIDSNIASLVKNFEAIQVAPNNAHNTQDINISIGDIQLSGVNDVNSLSRAIINQLPNQLLQEIHKR